MSLLSLTSPRVGIAASFDNAEVGTRSVRAPSSRFYKEKTPDWVRSFLGLINFKGLGMFMALELPLALVLLLLAREER